MPSEFGTLIYFAVLAAVILFALRTTILGRGFWVPLREMFRTPDTAQYPEHPQPVAERFHGRHQLNRYEDGLERCIGCELCAWACPADAIYVQGADNTSAERFSPGERFAEDYQINYSRCILCGLCIEACPTRALTMTHDYELSADSRNGLIYTKEMLLAPVIGEASDTPHRDRDVQDRGINYYGGDMVSPPTLLGGGDFLPATNRKRYRSGDVIPTGVRTDAEGES